MLETDGLVIFTQRMSSLLNRLHSGSARRSSAKRRNPPPLPRVLPPTSISSHARCERLHVWVSPSESFLFFSPPVFLYYSSLSSCALIPPPDGIHGKAASLVSIIICRHRYCRQGGNGWRQGQTLVHVGGEQVQRHVMLDDAPSPFLASMDTDELQSGGNGNIFIETFK